MEKFCVIITMDESFSAGGNLFEEILELGNQARDMIAAWSDVLMSGEVKRYHVREAKTVIITLRESLHDLEQRL